MPHICGDEILAFMMMLPWVGGAFLWLKMKFEHRFLLRKPAHHTNCEYLAATKLDTDWAGNHPVSCTCAEERSREQHSGSTYRD